MQRPIYSGPVAPALSSGKQRKGFFGWKPRKYEKKNQNLRLQHRKFPKVIEC